MGEGIPVTLVPTLRQCLIGRELRKGVALADVGLAWVENPNLQDPLLIPLLKELGLWIDFEFALLQPLDQAVRRLMPGAFARASYANGLLLRFAESTIAMHREHFEEACEGFREVRAARAKETLRDPHLHLIANFFGARCCYNRDLHDEALEFRDRALETAAGLDDARLQRAAIDILSSRIIIKYEEKDVAVKEAGALLHAAAEEFKSTDDNVSMGNIFGFQADIAKMRQQPEEALKKLHRAITEFESRPSKVGHPGEARARLHRARLQREIALDLMERAALQGTRARRDDVLSRAIYNGHRLAAAAAMEFPKLANLMTISCQELQENVDREAGPVEQLDAEDLTAKAAESQRVALDDVSAAVMTYLNLGHGRGHANALVIRGDIRLDSGDLEGALEDASNAYSLACARDDHRASTRASLLGLAVTRKKTEEGTASEEDLENVTAWSTRALEHAKRAEPRLLGRALVGAVQAKFQEDPEAVNDAEVKSMFDQAVDIWRKYPSASLDRELKALRTKLNPGGQAVAELTGWLTKRRGMSLAQIEKVVLRAVWEDTQNISRLSEVLGLDYNTARRKCAKAGIPVAGRQNVKKEKDVREESIASSIIAEDGG